MKKDITINGRKHTIKIREEHAPVERVIPTKKQYNRNKNKQNTRDYLKELDK